MGFKVDLHFVSVESILHALSPMLDKRVDGDRPNFTVERREPFSVSVHANDGYNYDVEPSRIAVSFQHSMKMRAVSGGPPVVEMLSHPLPYTQLLPRVAKELRDLTSLACAQTTRGIWRIGVVATAMVASDDIPPGIARFIKYMSRPWKGFTDYYTFQITAQLSEHSGWSDRCIHTVSKAEDDPEQLIRLNLDWQRMFKTGRAITTESMIELGDACEQSAMHYFEDLAEGNRFDEELIREAT